MPLVLTFLILIAVFIIIVLSTIKFEIVDFELSNIIQITPKNYKIKLSFYLFEKIKLFSFKLNSERARKMYSKMNIEKFDIEKGRKLLTIKNINILKKLNTRLDYLDLELDLGLEDAIFTTELITLISTVISNILPHIISKYIPNKYRYKIMPIYINKNAYYIKLNCIFQLKIVHIINIIYIYIKIYYFLYLFSIGLLYYYFLIFLFHLYMYLYIL